MLNLKTLYSKPRFKKDDGYNIVDLVKGTINFNDTNAETFRTYVVEPEFRMRPDLISLYALGSQEYTCLLLKYNGISNFFSIDTGMVLKIPTAEVLDNMIKKALDVSLDRTKNKRATVVIAQTRKDKKRLESFNNPIPPNFNSDAAQNIKFDNGTIIFGENVTEIKKDCGGSVSRARFKDKLIKNNIFNL